MNQKNITNIYNQLRIEVPVPIYSRNIEWQKNRWHCLSQLLTLTIYWNSTKIYTCYSRFKIKILIVFFNNCQNLYPYIVLRRFHTACEKKISQNQLQYAMAFFVNFTNFGKFKICQTLKLYIRRATQYNISCINEMLYNINQI